MTGEEGLLPLSALQHLVFCERQFALIHVEGQWVENPLTVQGKALHEQTDTGPGESRGDVRIARSLALRCKRLGIVGRADVVEFHRESEDQLEERPGVVLTDVAGLWSAFPGEYKRGRPKSHDADRVQLCAQALCLEEMLDAPVPEGALFYGKTRRRQPVTFDRALRRQTEEAVARARALLVEGRTPAAVRQPKCRRCSLLELCRPDVVGRSVGDYLNRRLAEV